MKKKINILLAAVVLGLWGTVMYKYVNRFFYSENTLTLTEKNLDLNLPDKIQKDTFELKPLGNDPFLNKSYMKPLVKKTTLTGYVPKTKVKSQPIKSKTVAPFPTVKYFGFIKSSERKEELILLKINNTLHKTRLNGNCDGVTVKKIYKDSIQIIFDKETRMIKK